MMPKVENLYSAQDHLRKEQQKLLKALLQKTNSAKTILEPSSAPGIDIKMLEKDMKASLHSGRKHVHQGKN